MRKVLYFSSCAMEPRYRDSSFVSTSVPQRIVEQQNVDVDGVTGATMTSLGIKMAVKNALTAAGVDVSLFQKGSDAVTDKQELDAQHADIVIVGSGMGTSTYTGAIAADAALEDL